MKIIADLTNGSSDQSPFLNMIVQGMSSRNIYLLLDDASMGAHISPGHNQAQSNFHLFFFFF